MSGPVLLLSDLHLPTQASPLRLKFAEFLEGPARTAEAVYILGDLFEYWIGDDLGLVEYADEVRRLRALTESGVTVYLMHGNRDFLIGSRFAEASGVTLLNDPTIRTLGNVPTLLSHGDLFCADDLPYQRWRRFSRNRFVQGIFLRLPAPLRQRFAGSARSRSDADKRLKPQAIMDVNPEAVAAAFMSHRLARIIHGHTHRPAEHVERVNGRICTRIVLADWRVGHCEYLRCDGAACERVVLDN